MDEDDKITAHSAGLAAIVTGSFAYFLIFPISNSFNASIWWPVGISMFMFLVLTGKGIEMSKQSAVLNAQYNQTKK